MSTLTREGTAEPVSRDQIVMRERGQGKIPIFPVELTTSRIGNLTRFVQMTSSRVRLGQSFKTVGYGCASCWGDVGAGNVEADIFYIPFIVSVQYIGY